MRPLRPMKVATLATAMMVAVSTLGPSTAPLAARAAVAQAPVTLSWFMRIDPLENAWEKQEISAFEAAHPNIHIKLITPPSAQVITKLNTLLNSTPPDISFWAFENMYGRGLLLDLNPLIKQYGFDFGQTPAGTVNIFRRGAGLYALPADQLGTFLFYNRDMFDAYNKAHPNAKIAYPPVDWNDRSWTWAKMVADAQKLTDPAVHQFGIVSSVYPQSAYAWLAGGTFFAPSDYRTGTATHIALNSPALARILQNVADWSNKDHIAPTAADAVSAGATGGDLFAAGKVAMELNGGWGFRNLNTATFHWSAAAVPYYVTNKVPLFTDAFQILKSTKHPAEAFEFVKFLLSPSSMQNYAKIVAFTPANLSNQAVWYQQESRNTGLTAGQLHTLLSGVSAHGQESDDHTIVNFPEIYTLLTNGLAPIFSGSTTAAKQLPVVESDINNQLKLGQ